MTKMPGKRLKIAIVGNLVDSVTSLSNYLEAKGFQTVWAYNGRDAVVLCNKEHPDLLIIDVKLDLINGFDVARLLPQQKVLFMSALEGITAQAATFKNSVGIIAKPIDTEQVLAILKKEFKLPDYSEI